MTPPRMQPASNYLYWARKWLATAQYQRARGRSSYLETFAAMLSLRRYRMAVRQEAGQ